MSIETEGVACPACGLPGPVTPEASGPDFDMRACGDQEFSLVRCGPCAAYYLSPRPTTAMLPVIYGADTYYAYTFAERANPTVLKARQRRNAAKARHAIALTGKQASEIRALDIGAGDGGLLDAFQAEGVPPAHLTGIDIDEGAVARLGEQGYRGILGRIEDVDLGGPYDVITMIQVIEHLAFPADVVRRCAAALRPGGVLLVETPNMRSWDRPLFRRRLWGGYHFPRHWTLWDVRSLPAFLRGHGLETVHVSTLSAAVVWAWSVNHACQDLGVPPRVSRVFGMQNPLALGMFWALDLVPSWLGWSANMRVVARAR